MDRNKVSFSDVVSDSKESERRGGKTTRFQKEKKRAVRMAERLVCASDSRILETKGIFRLTQGDAPSNSNYIVVERTSNVVQVREDESLFELETASDDVPSILEGELLDIFQFEVWLEEELLVV